MFTVALKNGRYFLSAREKVGAIARKDVSPGRGRTPAAGNLFSFLSALSISDLRLES